MRALTPFHAVSCLLLLAAGCPGPSEKAAAAGGVASLTVSGGGPVQGLEVVFQRPDGSVIASAQTDAAGKASATIDAGAIVTVGRYYALPSPRWELTSVVGVNPGDDLVIARAPFGSSAGKADVTFPGPVTSATEYRVDVACNSAVAFAVGSPVSVPFYSTCGSSVTALTLAKGTGGTPLAWSTAVDLPVTGTVPSQSAAGTSSAWRSDFGTLALTLTNPPTGASTATATLTPRRNGFRFPGSSTLGTATLAASTALDVPYAQAFGTSARLEVRVVYPSVADESRRIENESTYASRTLDLATAIPPRVSGATVVEAAGVRTGSWALAGADAALDATTLSASWTDGAGRHDWNVVLPPTATSFRFPAMPAALTAFPPAAGTALSWFEVTVNDVSTSAGYDAFRKSNLGLVYELPETGTWTLRRSTSVGF